MRPPGYEPGELPTAPLRDINHIVCNPDLLAISIVLNCECKGKAFYLYLQIFMQLFSILFENSLF